MTNQEKINILAKEAQEKFEKAKMRILEELMADVNHVTDEREEKKEPKATLEDLMEDYGEDMVRLGNRETEYFGDGIKNIDIAFDGCCPDEEMPGSLAIEYNADIEKATLLAALTQALALVANDYFASIDVKVDEKKLSGMFAAAVGKVLLDAAFSNVGDNWKELLKEVIEA